MYSLWYNIDELRTFSMKSINKIASSTKTTNESNLFAHSFHQMFI